LKKLFHFIRPTGHAPSSPPATEHTADLSQGDRDRNSRWATLGAAALYFGLALLVALALAVSVLRFWLLPKASDYRRTLEARIGERLGETVHIGTLSARLRGLDPELSLNDLWIADRQGKPVLRAAGVRFGLDLWRTLATGRPAFHRIRIVGTRLSARRNGDGSLGIAGFSATGHPPGWLLATRHIELEACELDWQDLSTGGPPLALGRMNLRLANDGDRHRLAADVALPDALGKTFRLRVDATGDPFRADGWQGAIHLEGRQIDAARIAGAIPPTTFGIRSGTADFRVWGHWRPGRRDLAGDVELARPMLAYRPSGGVENLLAMTALSGQFRWRREESAWRLELNRFQPALGDPWPETRLALAVDLDADRQPATIRAAASHLDLGDLEAALHALPVLGPETGALLRALAPRGSVRDLKVFAEPAAPPGERIALCADFREVGINPWRAVPGLTGLNGKICGNDRNGRAEISVADGAIRLPHLGLKKTVPLDRASADLAWRQTDGDWTVAARSFAVENGDLQAAAKFRLALPKEPGASPLLDLRAEIRGLGAAALKNYLPFAVIPHTSAWFEKALLGGRIRRCDLVLRGPTVHFPFPRNEGVFEALFETENVELLFHPQWPPLTNADARVLFRGPGVEIESRKGRIGRAELAEAHAAVENLNHAPWLAIAGSARATIPEAFDVLLQSPVRKIPEQLSKLAAVAGDTEVTLDLAVPLDKRLGMISVAGSALLRNASLTFDGIGLPVGRIEGTLNFTRDSLGADSVRAELLGHPASVKISRDANDILIDLAGRAGVAALQKRFPSGLWQRARGSADYRLNLRIPESLNAQSDPFRLRLSSDLAGLALDLPAPLGKPERAKKDLAIETSLRSGGKIPVKLAYGPNLRAQLRFSEPAAGLRLENGQIALGRLLPQATPEPGLSIFARTEQLDALEWRRLASELPSAAEAGPEAGNLLRQLELDVEQFRWGEKNLGRFALSLHREDRLWKGRIDSSHGKGMLEGSPESLRVDLDHLNIPQPEGNGGDRPSDSAPPEPGSIPSLRLKVRHLLWRNVDFGPLDLETERQPRSMMIKTLKIETKNHRLDLRGSWTRPSDRPAATRFEGKLHIGDMGRFLASLGQAGEMRDTPADLDFTLSWPGAPQQFSTASVAGDIAMRLGKGGLLRIEPGLGRMLGMFNLDTLWRRLNFDFSDLFGKGLAYDGLGGTFRLENGQALTKGFLIDAVPAKIVVNGRAGLVAKDLDQIVTVIPHTTAALPIAGALAGGPAVGAAIFLAQRLIGEQVDSITATHYTVKGSWDQPQITKIDRNIPLDLLDRAWSGMKDLSGFGKQEEEKNNE
jgi:uncharacterized protein (TIGR02099 family)